MLIKKRAYLSNFRLCFKGSLERVENGKIRHTKFCSLWGELEADFNGGNSGLNEIECTIYSNIQISVFFR